MRAFLDETYDRQLKVLSYIDNKGKTVSIKKISKNINLSEKTVLRIIRQFEQDDFFYSENFQIIYANKTIKGIYAKNIDLMTISSIYLKKSVLYKMVYNIFLYEKVDVKKFCELEYISPSTFSRYRQKLASILTQFGLSLSRDNKIDGEESKIRNFFFLFFSKASNEWNFKPQEYREIETYIYKHVEDWSLINQVKQRRICLLIYISNIRSSQRHECDNGVLVKLAKNASFQFKEVLLDYFYSQKNRVLDQVWQEVSFIQLFMYKEDLVTEEIQYDNYLAFFNEEYFPFIDYSNQLTDKIIEFFFSTYAGNPKKLFLRVRQEIDKMHLILSTCYIDVTIFSYVYNSANFHYRDATERRIIEQTQMIVTELITTTLYSKWWLEIKKNIDEPAFVEYVFELIYMLINELQEYAFSPVKVLVQNSKPLSETIITNKVALLFTDRIKLVSELRDDPDVLITDVYLPGITEQTRVVYVNSFSDLIDFNNAVDGIKQEMIRKFSHREIVNPLANEMQKL